MEIEVNAKSVLGLLVACALTLSACSAQKTLARRLAQADRVVVTNTHDGLSIIVTGGEVDKVIRALEAGKKENPYVEASPYLQFQFFKGAQHLGAVTTCVEIFWADGKPYRDPTGTLEALTLRYREAHPPHAL